MDIAIAAANWDIRIPTRRAVSWAETYPGSGVVAVSFDGGGSVRIPEHIFDRDMDRIMSLDMARCMSEYGAQAQAGRATA